MKKLMHVLIADGNTAGGIEEYFYRILKISNISTKANFVCIDWKIFRRIKFEDIRISHLTGLVLFPRMQDRFQY